MDPKQYRDWLEAAKTTGKEVLTTYDDALKYETDLRARQVAKNGVHKVKRLLRRVDKELKRVAE